MTRRDEDWPYPVSLSVIALVLTVAYWVWGRA